MDIISQLQEQANTIAALAFNTFGTLQRDAPPVRLSPNYPEPPPITAEDAAVNVSEQPKPLSAALIKAAKQVCHLQIRNALEFFLGIVPHGFPQISRYTKIGFAV
jgi:hypothetical protein